MRPTCRRDTPGMARVSLLIIPVICGFLLPAKGQYPQPGAMGPVGPERRSIIDGALGRRYCHWNERWKWCQSPDCGEWRCEYLFQGWPKHCRFGCQTRCFCRRGFFRDANGFCVGIFKCLFHRRLYVANGVNLASSANATSRSE
uniref:TIL domain containing protein n=1 Tax=Rhipicephalus zambeziensis TaxID=60191 RepID=A0A224YQG1_9ACAR